MNFCSTMIAAILLIGCILALCFVASVCARLALAILFIVLFTIGLGVPKGASREGVFAATVAYTAVLIMSVSGNFRINGGGG